MRKFIIVLSFCMMIFGVTAFAETMPFTNLPSVTSNYSNYAIYKSSSNGLYHILLTNNSNFYTRNNNILSNYSSGSFYGSSDAIYYWDTSTSKWVTYGYLANTTMLSGTSVYYSSAPLYSTDGISPGALIQNKLVFTEPPKPVAQMALPALGSLTTAFGGQLGVILPIGVAVLATLLGVSLIPRLVHSFL